MKLTKDNLIDIVLQVCEAWEVDTPKIEFAKMEEVLAFVLFNRNPTIIFNTELLQYPFNKILQVVYHELAHLITKREDHDHEFEIFCKLNNIPLSGEDWEETTEY